MGTLLVESVLERSGYDAWLPSLDILWDVQGSSDLGIVHIIQEWLTEGAVDFFIGDLFLLLVFLGTQNVLFDILSPWSIAIQAEVSLVTLDLATNHGHTLKASFVHFEFVGLWRHFEGELILETPALAIHVVKVDFLSV